MLVVDTLDHIFHLRELARDRGEGRGDMSLEILLDNLSPLQIATQSRREGVALLGEGLDVFVDGGGAGLQQLFRHEVFDVGKHVDVSSRIGVDVPNTPVEGLFDGIHRLDDATLQLLNLEPLLTRDLHYEEAQLFDTASH